MSTTRGCCGRSHDTRERSIALRSGLHGCDRVNCCHRADTDVAVAMSWTGSGGEIAGEPPISAGVAQSID
jgi:hypothetical protein